MEPSFDHWTSLFLIAACQGIFLVVLLIRKGVVKDRFLAGLILSFSLCLIYYVLYWTGYNKLLPRQLGAAQGLTFLFGPLLLEYIKTDHSSRKFNYLHLVPFALYLIRYLVDSPLRLIPGSWMALVQIIHLVAYTVLIIRWSLKSDSKTNTPNWSLTWNMKLALAFLGYVVAFTSYFILVWAGLLKIEYDYAISAASSFFIYFIGYHGFHYRELPAIPRAARYENSGLTRAASISIAKKLVGLMSEEKVYLNSSLKLSDLADKLAIQPHYVSQVINEIEGKNFAEFVNEYRINEAKRLLEQTDQKIISVALSSGFNNKASFNHSFKKLTGMSPSSYRQSKCLEEEKGKVLSV